jgi:methyl-accepting chemotaxis protein
MNSFEEIVPANRRDRFNGYLRGVLESNKNYLGIYSLWEADALDGMDAEYANAEGHDASGRYMPFFHRLEGDIQFEPLSASPLYDSIAEKYQNASPNMSDGVWLESSRGKLMTARIAYPIIVDGTTKVLGRVGIILDLAKSQEFIVQLKPYGAGQAAEYSSDGTIVCCFNPARIGGSIDDAESKATLGEKISAEAKAALLAGKNYSAETAGMFLFSYPFNVEGIKNSWTILATVPSAAVLEGVNNLMKVALVIVAAAVLLAVAITFVVLRSSVLKRLETLGGAIKNISQGDGDLTARLDKLKEDEIGDIAGYFNETIEKIRALMLSVKGQSGELSGIGDELSSNMTETAAAVNEIASNIQSIKTRVLNQSASVTETNATMEQITVNINKLNDEVGKFKIE